MEVESVETVDTSKIARTSTGKFELICLIKSQYEHNYIYMYLVKLLFF